MDQIQIIIPPVLIALNQGLKNVGMDSKYAIFVNWIGGIVLSVAFAYTGVVDYPTILNAVLWGFLLGSSAGGIYDAKDLPINTTRIKNLFLK